MDLNIKNTFQLFRLCYSIVSCFPIYFVPTKYLDIHVYVQSSVWRLPNYVLTTHPLSPRTKGGGLHSTHSPGGEGVRGGGSIFQYFGRRQTLDWPLTIPLRLFLIGQVKLKKRPYPGSSHLRPFSSHFTYSLKCSGSSVII
jgi:hypothetical protein